MGKAKWVLIALAVILLILALLVGTIVVLVVGSNTRFLLVETERVWHTELASGNYTGSHMCFDFPTYQMDQEGRKLEDWGNSKRSSFKLAYCSGSMAGGLLESGGASGVDYIDHLPFEVGESIPFGASRFKVNVTVDEDLNVLLDRTEKLLRGETRHFDYDLVVEHPYQDMETGENRTCMVRYVQNTTITNYGIWKLSEIEFGYSNEPYWWPHDMVTGERPKWSR